jgi:hypothetical protein
VARVLRCSFAPSLGAELKKEGSRRNWIAEKCCVRDEPWDEFRPGRDGQCEDQGGFLDQIFEVDLLEAYLRGVWGVRQKEVCENDVCEELEGASTVTDEPGFPQSASMGCVPRIYTRILRRLVETRSLPA